MHSSMIQSLSNPYCVSFATREMDLNQPSWFEQGLEHGRAVCVCLVTHSSVLREHVRKQLFMPSGHRFRPAALNCDQAAKEPSAASALMVCG